MLIYCIICYIAILIFMAPALFSGAFKERMQKEAEREDFTMKQMWIVMFFIILLAPISVPFSALVLLVSCICRVVRDK